MTRMRFTRRRVGVEKRKTERRREGETERSLRRFSGTDFGSLSLSATPDLDVD
jgi:hypothetical protein